MIRRTSLLLLSLLFVAHAEPARVNIANTGLSADRLQRIHDAMQRYIDRGEVAGVVTLVTRRGQVAWLDAQGQMDIAKKTPMRTDAIFRIASMTKPITSVAVMMLLEEGRFQLTDPVSKYLPEFKSMRVLVMNAPGQGVLPIRTVPAEREITIQHLLTHTAGLPNTYTGATELANKLAGERKAGDTIGDMVKKLAQLPLEFQPGAAWQYGPATDVLGRLVEVVSGMPFDQFLQKRIFDPMGMKDTRFYVPDESLPRLATNYEPADEKSIRAVTSQRRGSKVYFSGGGGLHSTAEDYLRFCQMLLNGGKAGESRLLSRKSIELMTVNHIGNSQIWPTLSGNRFGLGFRVLTDLGKAAHLGSLGSYGWGGAFGTYFWIDPKEEMAGILMVQIRPYSHLNLRMDFQNLATQAIVD